MDNRKKMLKLLDYLRQVGNLRQKLVKNLQVLVPGICFPAYGPQENPPLQS